MKADELWKKSLDILRDEINPNSFNLLFKMNLVFLMKITNRQLRRIIKEEKAKLLREQVGSDLFANVQMLVDQQTSIFDMADRLKALGHRDANYVSGMGMRYVEVMHNGQKHVVISKNMVEADASTQIIGPYSVGVLS